MVWRFHLEVYLLQDFPYTYINSKTYPSTIYFLLPLDVHGSEAPDAVYDQPAPGSPRPAPRRSPSPPLLPDDIGVGSLVEVATDVDQHYYGVVRWIGLVDGELSW